MRSNHPSPIAPSRTRIPTPVARFLLLVLVASAFAPAVTSEAAGDLDDVRVYHSPVLVATSSQDAKASTPLGSQDVRVLDAYLYDDDSSSTVDTFDEITLEWHDASGSALAVPSLSSFDFLYAINGGAARVIARAEFDAPANLWRFAELKNGANPSCSPACDITASSFSFNALKIKPADLKAEDAIHLTLDFSFATSTTPFQVQPVVPQDSVKFILPGTVVPGPAPAVGYAESQGPTAGDFAGTLLTLHGAPVAVRIMDAAGHAGSIVPATGFAVTTDDTVTLWGGRFDASDYFIDNTPVAWAITPTGNATLGSPVGLSSTVDFTKPGALGVAITHDTLTGANAAFTVGTGVLALVDVQCPSSVKANGEFACTGTGTDADGNPVDAPDVTFTATDKDGTDLEATETGFKAPASRSLGPLTITGTSGTVQGTESLTMAPTLTTIRIRDAPGGGGNDLTGITRTADDSISVWAAGYDEDDTFFAEVGDSWELTPGTIGTIGTAAGNGFTIAFEKATTGELKAKSGTVERKIPITITHGAEVASAVTCPESGVAGTDVTCTVTGTDSDGNTFASSATYMVTDAAGNGLDGDGDGIFTLPTSTDAAPVTVVATTTNGDRTTTLGIGPGALASFTLDCPAKVEVATVVSCTATHGRDQYGNAAPTGTPTLTGTDQSGAALPADSTGVTVPEQVADGPVAITGTLPGGIQASDSVGLDASHVVSFDVGCPTTATAGATATCITMNGEDAYGNAVTGFAAVFAAVDQSGVDHDTNGDGSFTLPRKVSDGPVVVTASTAHASGSREITIEAGIASAFKVSCPTTMVPATEFTCSTTDWKDSHGNTAIPLDVAWTFTDIAGDTLATSAVASPSFTTPERVQDLGVRAVSENHEDSVTVGMTGGPLAAYDLSCPGTTAAGADVTCSVRSLVDAFGNPTTHTVATRRATDNDGSSRPVTATAVAGGEDLTFKAPQSVEAGPIALSIAYDDIERHAQSAVEPAAAATFTLTCPESVIVARSFTCDVTNVRDAYGNLRTGDVPSYRMTPADNTAAGTSDDGTFTAPGRVSSGPVGILATVGTATAARSVALLASDLAAFDVTCPGAATVATDVTCTVGNGRDAHGNAVPTGDVTLKAFTKFTRELAVDDAGSFTLPTRVDEGTVMARATAANGVTAKAYITLLAGPLASLALTCPASVQVDTVIRCTTSNGADQYGNPTGLDGVTVQAADSAGGPLAPTSPGTFPVPTSVTKGPVTVQATNGQTILKTATTALTAAGLHTFNLGCAPTVTVGAEFTCTVAGGADRHGNPVDPRHVNLTGTDSSGTNLPGNKPMSFVAPGDATRGPLTVIGKQADIIRSAHVDLTASTARTFSFTCPARVVVDTMVACTVGASKDAYGNVLAPPTATVTVTDAAGTVIPYDDATGGARVPGDASRGPLTIVAVAGDMRETRTLAIGAGAVAAFTLNCPTSVVERTPVQCRTSEAVDANGNRVATPSAHYVVTDADGIDLDPNNDGSFTASRRAASSPMTVTATVDGVTRTTTIAVVTAPPAPAPATGGSPSSSSNPPPPAPSPEASTLDVDCPEAIVAGVVTCTATARKADGTTVSVTVTYTVTDKDGVPLDPDGDGTFTLPSSTARGPLTLVATGGGVTSARELRILAAAPDSVTPRPPVPTRFTAGSPVTAAFTVTDKHGNPANDGTPITLVVEGADGGTLHTFRATTAGGVATFRDMIVDSDGTVRLAVLVDGARLGSVGAIVAPRADTGTDGTDPGTGTTDPGSGTTDPGTGTTDPGSGTGVRKVTVPVTLPADLEALARVTVESRTAFDAKSIITETSVAPRAGWPRLGDGYASIGYVAYAVPGAEDGARFTILSGTTVPQDFRVLVIEDGAWKEVPASIGRSVDGLVEITVDAPGSGVIALVSSVDVAPDGGTLSGGEAESRSIEEPTGFNWLPVILIGLGAAIVITVVLVIRR